jgi:hypothetical protein
VTLYRGFVTFARVLAVRAWVIVFAAGTGGGEQPPPAEIAAVLRAVAASPGARATPKAVAEHLARGRRDTARLLRDAERAGLLTSAITLVDEPGQDRMYWLTEAGQRAINDRS